MCLAIPGQLIEVFADGAGAVSFDGVVRKVDLSFVPESVVGDFVVVHAGFAITILDEKEALASIAEFNALQSFSGEGGE